MSRTPANIVTVVAAPRSRATAAFTLVELLVVLGILSVLIGVLVPVVKGARESANLARCQSNLRAIGAGVTAYAMSNDGRLPSKSMLGSFPYRLAPGERNDYDPNALRETYGLAAILHGIKPGAMMPDDVQVLKGTYIDGLSDVWVCPSQTEKMKSHRNTYAFSIADAFAKSFRLAKPDYVVAWDNHLYTPAPSGFNGPFSGFTLPTNMRVIPHKGRKVGQGIVCELQIGGHVDMRVVD